MNPFDLRDAVKEINGRSETEAQRSLRFSLGPSNTEAEIDRLVEVLERCVDRLRARAQGGSGIQLRAA